MLDLFDLTIYLLNDACKMLIFVGLFKLIKGRHFCSWLDCFPCCKSHFWNLKPDLALSLLFYLKWITWKSRLRWMQQQELEICSMNSHGCAFNYFAKQHININQMNQFLNSPFSVIFRNDNGNFLCSFFIVFIFL